MRSQLHIQSSSRRINHTTDTERHIRTFGANPFAQLSEYLVRKIAAIGELERTYATRIASADNMFADFHIRVVENRNHRCLGYLSHHLEFIKIRHLYDLRFYDLRFYD